MSTLYLALGVITLGIVVVDLLWTALWPDGAAGPFSSRYTSLMWRVLRRTGGPRSRRLSLAGPIILSATLLAWVALLWGGWTLIFAGDPDSLIDTRDGGPVSWVERLYFVAYSMFTMGNGDFSPRDGWPQIATSLTTASGMLFVTMGVSYVLSILTAVNQKRAFAGAVWGLGGRAEDIVVTGWNGEDTQQLDLPLNDLGSRLSLLADQHKAYPILHYYHSETAKNASAMAAAILDEALTLLTEAIPTEHQGNAAVVASTRSSLSSYLDTLHSAFIKPADRTPPRPDLDVLRAAGVPTVTDEQFDDSLAHLADRRRRLLGLIQGDEWYWTSGRSV